MNDISTTQSYFALIDDRQIQVLVDLLILRCVKQLKYILVITVLNRG